MIHLSQTTHAANERPAKNSRTVQKIVLAVNSYKINASKPKLKHQNEVFCCVFCGRKNHLTESC